jgi:hypothetical protein
MQPLRGADTFRQRPEISPTVWARGAVPGIGTNDLVASNSQREAPPHPAAISSEFTVVVCGIVTAAGASLGWRTHKMPMGPLTRRRTALTLACLLPAQLIALPPA